MICTPFTGCPVKGVHIIPGWRLFFFANFINKSSKRNQHYNKFKQV